MINIAFKRSLALPRWIAGLLVAWLAPLTAAAQAPGPACNTLASFATPTAQVTDTALVAAGSFSPPGSDNQPPQYRELPEFCRVTLVLTPSADSEIGVELWLPVQGWNGKFMGVGNGAFNGNISHGALATALARGYAAASTDTGHSGNNARFGLGHPEKVIDFGWRAVHEMTVTAKQVIGQYYQQPPAWSYWNGCSAGGRQAMKEAQRFPQDYDGIIAGAPGLDWTGRAVSALRIAQHLSANPGAQLTAEQRDLLAQAVLASCDNADGVADGIIGRPAQCRFDPAELACSTVGNSSCLNPDQIRAINMIYESPPNPDSGRAITGLLPGSESGWTDLGWTGSARATGLDQLRYLVYGDADWTIDRFDFATDAVRAETADNDTLNALDPDLSGFLGRGGKLIQYHGWSDPQISPANSTQYYERVTDLLGGRARIHDAYRLFMAPGMGHCSGGAGPNSFDMVTALEDWVERGRAPDAIIASKLEQGNVVMTRPLCPYPEEAVYDGSGSTNVADNFSCRLPDNP